MSGNKEPKYRLDDVTIDYVIAIKNSIKFGEFLTSKKSDKVYSDEEFKKLFGEDDFKSLSFTALHDLRTGMYLTAFRAGDLGYNGTYLD